MQLFKATRELLDTLMRESGFTHYPDVDALVWELASKEHARRDAARSRVHASADGRNAPSLEQ